MIDDGAEEMWSRSGRRTVWFGEIFFLLGGVILCTAKLSMDGLVAGHIKRFLSFFLSFISILFIFGEGMISLAGAMSALEWFVFTRWA